MLRSLFQILMKGVISEGNRTTNESKTVSSLMHFHFNVVTSGFLVLIRREQ